MVGYTLSSRSRRRGGVLISALAITLVIAFILAGIGTFTVEHYSRAMTESRYSGTLNLAEAGINYELRKISQNAANADQVSANNPQGNTYSFGSGTFTVYCTNRDGSTPWTPPNDLYIYSTAYLKGNTRTVKIAATGMSNTATPSFGIYGMNSVLLHAPNASVSGDVGTNGSMTLHGHISGSVYIDGPNATGSGAGANASTTTLSFPLIYPTVSQIALQLFPNSGSTAPGGLAYLATHNDNAKAGLPTIGAVITGPVTLTGPGNYYVTAITLANADQITCNNTNGPINIWVGPLGGPGVASFTGTSGNTVTSTRKGYQVTFYVATTGGVSMTSSPTLTATFYAINQDLLGNYYGPINGWNSPSITGSLIGADVFQSGNTLVGYAPGPKVPLPVDYYGFDKYWFEVGGM